MSMQVLEQKFILLSTLFLNFAIIPLNKTKYTNQENALCIVLEGGGGGGLNLASLKHALLP